MKIELKDGKEIEIVQLSSEIPVISLCEYINTLVEEDTFIRTDRPFCFEEEERYVFDVLEGMRKNEQDYLAVLYGKKVVGGITARRGIGKERNNVEMGIGILKEFRGIGLGEILLKEMVKRVREKMNPENIYLHTASGNKPAICLYEKMGFRKIATLPKWMKHKGEYYDMYWMVLV